MVTIKVNGQDLTHDVEDRTPLLWVLREQCGLTGTKFGCGVSMCGACTVLVNGEPTRSCVRRVSTVTGTEITTIEGLGDGQLHPVQQAWLEMQVPQCGYCQAGQMLAAVGLLKKIPAPTDADIDQYMDGVICRCGTYNEIRAAIKRAAVLMAAGG